MQGDEAPPVVFGQTAFFFHVAHILFLELSARTLHVRGQLDLETALLPASP